jgi:putative phosphoesterase
MSIIRKAVDLFNEREVGYVLHAGDLISPFTLDIFRELRCNFSAIFGNNDGDKLLLKHKSNGAIHNQPHITTIQKRRIIVIHEPDLVDALAGSRYFDLIIYGHTHQADIRKVTRTTIINPGKASRLLKGKATVALLDLKKMDAEIVELK